MRTHILSVFLDYKCNFWCDHCSVGSNPQLRKPMEEIVFDSLIQQLDSMESVHLVAFTGGECTLDMKRLTKAIRASKEAGKQTRVVTNSWFAKNDKLTNKILDELCEAGLDEISTSFDSYHEPFVSLEQVARMLKHAYARGLRLALGVIEDPEQRWTLDKVKKILAEYCEWDFSRIDEYVSVISDSPTPVGTADRAEIYESRTSASTALGCSDIVKTISLHPNGDLKACCGHTMFYQKDLHLGNVKNERINDIFQRASMNLAYWYIHVKGPTAILAEMGYTGHFTSICHACSVLLNNHGDEYVQYLKKKSRVEVAQDLVFQNNLKKATQVLIANEEELLARLRSSNRVQRLSSSAMPDLKR